MSAGFSANATVCPTTQQRVLNAVVEKLRTDIAEFASESTCFLSTTASPGIEIHEDLFCTVAPIDGLFDERTPVGAGSRGIVEAAFIQVTVFSRMMLDRLEHSAQSFTDSSRGLLQLKQRVLQSLAGQQLYGDAPVNSVPLLIEFLRPVRSLHPGFDKGADDLRSFGLVFRGPFHWDLPDVSGA